MKFKANVILFLFVNIFSFNFLIASSNLIKTNIWLPKKLVINSENYSEYMKIFEKIPIFAIEEKGNSIRIWGRRDENQFVKCKLFKQKNKILKISKPRIGYLKVDDPMINLEAENQYYIKKENNQLFLIIENNSKIDTIVYIDRINEYKFENPNFDIFKLSICGRYSLLKSENNISENNIELSINGTIKYSKIFDKFDVYFEGWGESVNERFLKIQKLNKSFNILRKNDNSMELYEISDTSQRKCIYLFTR